MLTYGEETKPKILIIYKTPSTICSSGRPLKRLIIGDHTIDENDEASSKIILPREISCCWNTNQIE